MKFVLASVSALGLEWMSDSVARVDDPAVVGKDTVTVLSEYVVRANPRELAAMSFDWIFSRRAYSNIFEYFLSSKYSHNCGPEK